MDRSCGYSLTLLVVGTCAGWGAALDPELESVAAAGEALERRNARCAGGLVANTLIGSAFLA